MKVFVTIVSEESGRFLTDSPALTDLSTLRALCAYADHSPEPKVKALAWEIFRMVEKISEVEG